MGWLYTRQTRDQLIATLIQPRSSEEASSEVLEHHMAGHVLWSLVRLTAKKEGFHRIQPGEAMVFIRCDLLDQAPDGWGHKALEEAVFPYYFSCPLHYLDLAPEQSADWRVNVRKFHSNEAGKVVVRQLKSVSAS